MANAFGMVDEALWRRDRDFRALSRSAQCTFVQLLSQRDLDCAGVLTLHVELLAKACDEVTVEDIWRDLRELEAAGFIYVDTDTDELLIRSYVRRPAGRPPNILKAAYKAARAVSSPKLRSVLARELRRLNKAEADTVADEIDAGWEPIPNPSETVPESIGNPSTPRKPSGTHSNGISTDTDTSLDSPTVVGHLGGTRAGAQARDDTDPSGQSPPSRTCQSHPSGTTDNCGGCADARRAYEHWEIRQAKADAERARAEAAERVESARAAVEAIEACPLCDADGYRMPDHRSVCDHTDRTKTARAGIAKVRAALKDVSNA